jgi:hypothetical protein
MAQKTHIDRRVSRLVNGYTDLSVYGQEGRVT